MKARLSAGQISSHAGASCHIAVRLTDFQIPKVDEDLEIYVSLFHKGSNISSSFQSERGGLEMPQK
jgi:hypothetical protein